MKKINLALAGIMAAALLVSCASNDVKKEEPVAAPEPVVEKPAPAVSKSVTREMINWKGASIGAEIPSWVYDAVEDDYAALSKLPQLQKKKIICASDTGRDLDLLKSWVNNFDVQGSFSKSIKNFISAKFGGELAGSKDDSVSQNYLDEIVSGISRNEFSGLSKELDFWVQTRITDTTKDTVKDEYEYFVVYAIDNDDFEYQIAQALGIVEAANEAQKELKARVQKEMEETQVYYESKRK